MVSDELFDTRVSTRIFLVSGKYPYTNVRILRRGFVTQGFDSRCVVSSIKSRKSRRGSRARADATHLRSAAILAPLHSSRDRNTGESSFASVNARFCDRVPPRTRAAGRVSSCQLGDEVVRASCFEMSRETDGDRGASAGDPRFTSSEAPPRANVPYADIVPGRDSRPRVSHTAHARASPSVAPLRFSRFTQKTASVSLFSSPPASPRAFARR